MESITESIKESITESIIFGLTVVSFIVPLIATIIKPHPFQIQATIHAKQQGWSMPIILVTRALPFLTLYTQFWILIAMYYLTPTTMYIAQSMSLNVFLLYHGINLIDPMNLSYHSEKLVREVVRWYPPINFRIIIWVGLHLQHTFFPFYLFFLKSKHSISYEFCPWCFISSLFIMGIYVIWHLFCWQVQGIPAYPFLTKLRIIELEILFYICGLILMIIINNIIP